MFIITDPSLSAGIAPHSQIKVKVMTGSALFYAITCHFPISSLSLLPSLCLTEFG